MFRNISQILCLSGCHFQSQMPFRRPGNSVGCAFQLGSASFVHQNMPAVATAASVSSCFVSVQLIGGGHNPETTEVMAWS